MVQSEALVDVLKKKKKTTHRQGKAVQLGSEPNENFYTHLIICKKKKKNV